MSLGTGANLVSSLLELKQWRGAPRKPNMIAKKIKVDSILYSQVRDRCKQEGTTISSFLSVAIREELKKIEYN